MIGTKSRTKPPKLDLNAIIAAAPKEPEPRLIAEIYAELVAFPFRVRKIGTPPDSVWPIGSDLLIVSGPLIIIFRAALAKLEASCG